MPIQSWIRHNNTTWILQENASDSLVSRIVAIFPQVLATPTFDFLSSPVARPRVVVDISHLLLLQETTNEIQSLGQRLTQTNQPKNTIFPTATVVFSVPFRQYLSSNSSCFKECTTIPTHKLSSSIIIPEDGPPPTARDEEKNLNVTIITMAITTTTLTNTKYTLSMPSVQSVFLMNFSRVSPSI